MQGIIHSPVTSQDENLQVILTYEESDWLLTVQNLCNHDLKRMTIIFYPKPPVFVSKEKFKIGTVTAYSYSRPYRLSLRINHEALAVNKREIIKEPKKPEPVVSPQFRVNLLQILNTYMNLDDIKTLCFHLNIEEENVPGDIRERKAAELISLCQRKGLVPQLLQACRHLNPGAPWPDLPSTERDAPKNDIAEPVKDFPAQGFLLEFKAVYLVGSSAELQQFQNQLQLELA